MSIHDYNNQFIDESEFDKAFAMPTTTPVIGNDLAEFICDVWTNGPDNDRDSVGNRI